MLKLTRIALFTLGLYFIHHSIVVAEPLSFALSYGKGSHQYINNNMFARELSRSTLGQLTVGAHTVGATLTGPELLTSVSRGEYELGELILSSLTPVDPLFLVDNLPFLVEDFDDALALWKFTRPEVEQALAQRGVKLLYATPWPPQGLYTNRPPTRARDFKGMSIRSYSDMTRRYIQALDGIPIEVPYANVQTAFSNNTIEAMITSVSTGISSSAWNYTNVYTDVVLWIPKNAVFMNLDAYTRLSDEQRSALDKNAEQAEARGWRLAREEYYRSLISLSDNGLRVQKPDDSILDELTVIGDRVVDEWASDKAGTIHEAIAFMRSN